jgi:hypothetical protein
MAGFLRCYRHPAALQYPSHSVLSASTGNKAHVLRLIPLLLRHPGTAGTQEGG